MPRLQIDEAVAEICPGGRGIRQLDWSDKARYAEHFEAVEETPHFLLDGGLMLDAGQVSNPKSAAFFRRVGETRRVIVS